jgi:hypothetical protein
MPMPEEMQRRIDMEEIHYQPARQSTWCGAKYRAADRAKAGTEKPFAILRVKSTTDVSKVSCLDCLAGIRRALPGIKET